jgi:uncharacterized protein (TIGR03435 family)
MNTILKLRDRIVMTALALVLPILSVAQAPPRSATFDVVSVKLNKSKAPANSNFPLGPGNAYTRNGGRFSATGFALAMYINFAYKLMPAQIEQMAAQLPEWATADTSDIESPGARG